MKNFLIILLVIVGVSVMAWQLATPTYTYRYRLTVELETPDGIKSGSSVIEVKTEKMPNWLRTISSEETSVKGEPVYIDLGAGKNAVTVLLHGIWPKRNITDALFPRAIFNERCESIEYLKWAKRISQMKNGEVELPPILVPNIFTFSDIGNPKTAKALYESDYDGPCWETRTVVKDHFAEVLGKGYAFRKAMVTLTDEPIDKAISDETEKNIPWWGNPEAQREFWYFIDRNKGAA